MKRQIIRCGILILCIGTLPFSSAYSAEIAIQQTSQSSKRFDVRGTVSDAMGIIVGATVKVVGSKTGTVTDVNGTFHLKAVVGDKIEISCIGYETQTIVCKGQAVLKIRMKENAVALDNVQVIAYGVTRKATITGALASINQDDLLKSPVANMGNALAGKISGLSSIQTSGQPGADNAALFIRGVGSLNTSLSQPLILVDGVERPFSQIDPNEVDDITVLKDASATAVFGVRGANGVILVTTKRGMKEKPRLSFSTSIGFQIPSRICWKCSRLIWT